MTVNEVLDLLKSEDVAYVDVRFTDPKGKLQHVTLDVDLIDDLDEELLSDPRFAKLSTQPSDSNELIIDGGTTTDSQD